MSEVESIGVDRPESVALHTAIEDVIDEIAAGKMTPYEILGVLDMVSKEFHARIFPRDED